MRVAAPSYEITLVSYWTDDKGESHSVDVPSTHVDCARCGNAAEVFGTGTDSYDAACCQLRDTCPKGESNYYAAP